MMGFIWLKTDEGDDLPPKNWSKYYVRIREEKLQKEAGHPLVTVV